MAHDDGTSQARLTPEARRAMLRDFADRMLLKVTAMDDPEGLPGVERAVRTAAAIERIYSRCDRAEKHAPDPRKLEAERAVNAREAINARVHLAGTLEWGEKRRKDLGKWWDAADMSAKAPAQTPERAPVNTPAPVQQPAAQPAQSCAIQPEIQPAPAASAPAPASGPITLLDYTDAILAARAKLGLPPPSEDDWHEDILDKDGVHDPPDTA